MIPDCQNESWRLDNSYARLPAHFYTRLNPVAAPNPDLVMVNYALADDLGISLQGMDKGALAQMLAGNVLPNGAEPIAQAYAGHQFGHFTILGDGRAHLIGEHITPDNQRFDIQLKGSGKTPYGRRGDGRAALGPMLREYIISEAMHNLGIPTTRSLAVVTTGESVIRETPLQGAVLARVAASHIRVGTFEYFAARQDVESLKQLADYTINRHYPALAEKADPYANLIKAVMDRQIDLVVNWLRVGFIHGVMNTDNTAISGETIDYGPCAFMDAYDPDTVFSSIDHMGRYAYANQPTIIQWNMARFAEALLPLLHPDTAEGVAIAEEHVNAFPALFQNKWLKMMRAKLGLFGEENKDGDLIGGLLQCMQRHHMDYTNTFRDLISETMPKGEVYASNEFQSWWGQWKARLDRNAKPLKSSLCLMRASNPVIIPRNHKVEQALSEAEARSDFTRLHTLMNFLRNPYSDDERDNTYLQPPKPEERVYQTFCGT